jgi:hypothetical protein
MMETVTNKGDKYWYVIDKHYREGGAAIEHATGTKEWWLNGVQVTKEQVYLSGEQIDNMLWCHTTTKGFQRLAAQASQAVNDRKQNL